MEPRRIEARKSGFSRGAKSAKMLAFRASTLGQSYPQGCPYPGEAEPVAFREALGSPLSIQAVADLIGCSSWTVRQRYLVAGLPHHRLTPNGKLIFYQNQVIRWLLTQQEKGGMSL
jgi:hypothetical protein